jgi:hypothetical protein
MDENQISERQPLLPGWTSAPTVDVIRELDEEEALSFMERIQARMPRRPVTEPRPADT